MRMPSKARGAFLSIVKLGLILFISCLSAGTALAVGPSTLVYVPLSQPCRLLDTRAAGSVGMLTSAPPTLYTFGARDADITTAYQTGTAGVGGAGCGVPSGAVALSIYLNMPDATAAGNIYLWSTASGTTLPSGGTAPYNPSISPPGPGQVFYNTGYSVTAINPTDGRFYVAVTNGMINAIININGYWLPTPASAAGGIAFTSSTSLVAPTTIAGGLAGVQPVVPISGATLTTVPNASLIGLNVDLSNLLGVAQVFPQSGTVSTIHGDFANTAALSLVGSTVTVTATLYVAPAGSVQAAPTTLSCSASYTGIITLGTVTTCTPSGGPVAITAGDKGIIVFSATATGVSLVNVAAIGATVGISQ